MNFRKYIQQAVTAIIILSSTSIYAAEWSGEQNITELFVHINNVVVKLSGVHPNPAGCTNDIYLTLEPNSGPLFKEIYSMLLSAKMANIKVDIAVDGCGAVVSSHPRIVYARIM